MRRKPTLLSSVLLTSNLSNEQISIDCCKMYSCVSSFGEHIQYVGHMGHIFRINIMFFRGRQPYCSGGESDRWAACGLCCSQLILSRRSRSDTDATDSFGRSDVTFTNIFTYKAGAASQLCSCHSKCTDWRNESVGV